MIEPMLFAGLNSRVQHVARLSSKVTIFDDIVKAVGKELEIDPQLIVARIKRRDVSDARCISIGLILRVSPSSTLKRLGKYFGGRDHTSIIYHRDLFNDLYDLDKPFTEKVNRILALV